MRYLLIDRIEKLEPFKHLRAIKNISLSEDIYADHFVGCPITPGALLIESLAQAGTALLEVSTDFKKKALLVIIEQAKFRAFVRPGDQLVVNINVTSYSEDSAQMEGSIYLLEKPVMDARITFALREKEEFYPEKTRHLIEAIYDVWLRDTEFVGMPKKGGME